MQLAIEIDERSTGFRRPIGGGRLNPRPGIDLGLLRKCKMQNAKCKMQNAERVRVANVEQRAAYQLPATSVPPSRKSTCQNCFVDTILLLFISLFSLSLERRIIRRRPGSYSLASWLPRAERHISANAPELRSPRRSSCPPRLGLRRAPLGLSSGRRQSSRGPTPTPPVSAESPAGLVSGG